jgi:hypothetical protein
VLGERLRSSLPVMLESRAPIYPLESKLMLRYYLRSKVGRGAQMEVSLIAEAVTAIRALMAPFLGASFQAWDKVVAQSSPAPGGVHGVIQSPSNMGNQSMGFSLVQPRQLSSLSWSKFSFVEVGESSRSAHIRRMCYQTVGISYKGDAKRFLDFMAQVEKRQRQEVLVYAPKTKGRRGGKELGVLDQL